MKKIAFTLAEVLITLGIIGVVAALTLPTLINNWQEKVLLTKIRKSTRDIANAVDMFITEEGKTKLYLTSIYTKDSGLDDFITSKFNVVKTCEANESGCFYDGKYKSIDKSASQTFVCRGKSYILADSTAICANMPKYANNNVVGSINLTIDTNGAQKPNTGGKDIFEIFINCVNGKIEGKSHSISLTGGSLGFGINRAPECSSNSFGGKCYSQLLENNFTSMKYAKVSNRLDNDDNDDNNGNENREDHDIADDMLL